MHGFGRGGALLRPAGSRKFAHHPVGAMPTSAPEAVANSPQIFAKSVHSAGGQSRPPLQSAIFRDTQKYVAFESPQALRASSPCAQGEPWVRAAHEKRPGFPGKPGRTALNAACDIVFAFVFLHAVFDGVGGLVIALADPPQTFVKPLHPAWADVGIGPYANAGGSG